ncbi:MAG: lysophospholipid acyltransferase family protein [Desulfobacterales bacterium]|nr:MAG: lysophospholipid acyltransferase family protein [Desulfobacterales bacterium]
MNYTIFDTPVLKTFVRWFSVFFLWITGWRTEGQFPVIPRFVLVAAPHTSNWDLPYGLFSIFVFKAKIYWLGKEAIFRMPLKGFFKWLGGIPVDRSKSSNVVTQSIKQFHENERLILAITPAGTRKRVKKWKTGFYHIAAGANVPIVLGFLDYKRKVGGIGPVIYPTGDFEADIKTIRAFYDGIIGKYPDKSISPIDKRNGSDNSS